MALKIRTLKNLLPAISLIILLAEYQLAAQAQWSSMNQPGQNANNTGNTWTNYGGPNYGTNNSNNFPPNPVNNLFTNPSGSSAPGQNPAGFLSGLVNESNMNILNAGTVITGVLQENISSKSSKNADVFSVMLPENYTVYDRVLIPRYSKFIGTIVAASPAKQAHNGAPGNLQVSIQTLVSPDGISIPVNAFIDYNPNQDTKTNPNKSRGVPLDEWGKTVGYSILTFGGSIGSRTGLPFLYKGQTKGGKDFSLSKGELLPLKLTAPLDVTPLLSGKTQSILPSAAPSQPLINQNSNLPLPPDGQSTPNMMPDTTNPAGPEPF